MPRKLRFEEGGALYHVLNRGNYRQPVFASEGAAEAFLRALWETVGQFGWRVHAYVVMSNHYHIALETPLPNLSDGMHRLQSAFATRFNRYREERGHLFQGRFHALRVEGSSALSRVIDYIHLNPVRAKIVEPQAVDEYRWSSLRIFASGERPAGLVADSLLPERGLEDTEAGWLEYRARLVELAVDEAEQKRLGFEQMSRGWAIGTAGWKRALARELSHTTLVGLAQAEAKVLREARWHALLTELLSVRGFRPEDVGPLAPYAKDETWRLEAAASLRGHGVPYAWIAHALGFSKANTLKVKLFRFHKNVSM